MNTFEHLAAYNKLLAGMSMDFSLSTTNRRIHALMVFRRKHGHLLADLYVELQHLWPHWEIKCLIESEENYYNTLCMFFYRLEYNCHPETLDAWKPFITRTRNVVADEDKTVRRFLDSSPTKPKVSRCRRTNKLCRIHSDRRVLALGVCAGCYTRINKFRILGVITDDTPQELLDKLLRLDACRGRASNLLADAQELVRQYGPDGFRRG